MEQVIKIVPGQVRPRGVVYQHPIEIVGALLVKVQQRIEHRTRTLLTAIHTLDTRIAGTGQCRPIGIVRCHADHHALDGRMIEETAKAVFENCASAQLQVLLGSVRGHTGTYARGRNHGPKGR